jgi:CheY-like chemotaxis protein
VFRRSVDNVTASPFSSPRVLPRVLVVDGDADNRELYRDSFTLEGWKVTEAWDGREALVHALTSRPSIVVTELRLPLIDGVALCEILRKDRATELVPILMVTSETRAVELARAERAGANAVLIKPSTPEVIVAEMKRLVQAASVAASQAPPSRLPVPSGRRSLVRAHRRLSTTTPDQPPANLSCPICAQALRYQETFIGGVSSRHPERWDYYECARCGTFQYRNRTRKLRQLSFKA